MMMSGGDEEAEPVDVSVALLTVHTQQLR